MVQVIQAGPTERELRNRAFQKGIDQAVQGGSGVFNSIRENERFEEKRILGEEATRRKRALSDNDRITDLETRSGLVLTPEETQAVQDLGATGDVQVFRNRTSRLGEAIQRREKDDRDFDRQQKTLSIQSKRGASADRKADRAQRQTNKINDDFVKLGSVAIDPTSRRRFGRLQQNIDVADAAKTLSASIGVPEGKFANPKESHEQKIKRLDNMTAQQKSEFVKVLDRLLTQGAPTESGQAHLLPTSFQGDIRKWQQKLTATPTGQKEGKFIANILDTIERERAFNQRRQQKSLGKLGISFQHLRDADPIRFNAIISGDDPTFTPGTEEEFVALESEQPQQIPEGLSIADIPGDPRLPQQNIQIPFAPDAQAGQIPPSGLAPEQRRSRIEELLQKAGQR